MKIPKKLKICGRMYNVVYPYQYKERGDIKGQHDGDMQEIRIDGLDCWSHEERTKESIAVTFLHEILHACDCVSGHHIFKDNEPAIEGISEILYQVLHDNKLVFFDKTPPKGE